MTTLRDHFQEKAHNLVNNTDDSESDDWTIEYMDTKWLPSIAESFDDDGSGYITVAEINRFTQSRPDTLKWR